jgi:beta-aspartyl-peptidase (threonine type)
MIVVSSVNGKIGMVRAVEVLRAGGTALDAVEAGTREIERNAADHSVGLGGLPNVLGEVRLDALIMDGRTLRAAAVGSVRHQVHVITLARRLMEETPHVFLVADGAERFAREIGMPPEDPSTAGAAAKWRDGLRRRFPELDLSSLPERRTLRDLVQALNEPMAGWTPTHGTVNFLAQDGDGNLATAVSTSGWPWGYPGRLGDSPVIGAGGYADNRWGAAASTGTGEVTIRTSAARSVILYLKMGRSLSDALQEALQDLRDLHDPYADHIALIGLDRAGRHASYSHRPHERYVYMTDAMPEPAEVEAIHVAPR